MRHLHVTMLESVHSLLLRAVMFYWAFCTAYVPEIVPLAARLRVEFEVSSKMPGPSLIILCLKSSRFNSAGPGTS